MAVKPIVKFIRNSRGGDGNVDPQRLFGNLAQTNHYQVDFSSLGVSDSSRFETFGGQGGQGLLDHIESKFGVNLDFISRDSGLLCSEASLPGTSLATAEVKDNFMGISQEFAHTRLYTDFDFTFYVDNDYNNLRFFEGWIDFISSGSEINGTIPRTGRNGDGALPSQSNYYRRMRYPDSYKCQTISITKFEKNFGPRMTYSFMNAFPKLISAVPVSYGGADVLKVSVSFNYDRYVIGNNGFSKGIQGSFADPKQQSSELQQVKRNKFESLAGAPPAPVLPTPTEVAAQLVAQEQTAAAAEAARVKRLAEEAEKINNSGTVPSGSFNIPPETPEATPQLFDYKNPIPANRYGLLEGQEVSFVSQTTGETYVAANRQGGIVILQQGVNALGFDFRQILVTSATVAASAALGSKLPPNSWLFKDLNAAVVYSTSK